MSIHAWMMMSLLMGASPAPPAEAAPAPHLEKGVEIIWRGTFKEIILPPNVRAFRNYEVETRIYVFDVCAQGADVALYTSIKFKPELKTTPEPAPIVHQQLARIEPNGKMSRLPAEALTLPPEKRQPRPFPLAALEGLPTQETNFFVGIPAEKFRLGMAWTLPEAKRPAIRYRVDGTDSAHGLRCYRIVAIQQTEDWDIAHPDSAPWRRGETIDISAKYGYAIRIERIVEKRHPQTGEPCFHSKLIYEQINSMRYPERFGDDRRQEIIAGAQFLDEYERAIADPNRSDSKPFEHLLDRIGLHIMNHFSGEAVPYRAVVLAVKRKAEAARNGYIPPAPPLPETTDLPPLAIGKHAADVTTFDLTTNNPVSLSKLRGRPTVLLYYQTGSERTAMPVMQFAQGLYDSAGGRAFILPLAIGDREIALKQRADWRLSVPILAGRTVYKQHGIESAPCFVVLDENGIVRSVVLGWSKDNAEAVRAELGKWLK